MQHVRGAQGLNKSKAERGVLNWKMDQNLNLLINFAILVMCRGSF